MKSVTLNLGIALLAGACLLPACTKTASDPKDEVTTALKNANIRDVDVDYDRDARVIHLKGSVDNGAVRSRAEQIAEQAVGTSGKVLNEVTVRGVNDKTADDNDGRIKDQLKEMVDRDPQLKQHDVSFEVNNGAVEAKGSVASEAEKARVTELIRSVPGVKDVANGIEVRPSRTKTTRPISPPVPQR